MWKVRPKPGRPFGTFAGSDWGSGWAWGSGVLMLMSLVLTTAAEAVGRYAAGTLPGVGTGVRAVNLVTLFAAETVLFAMIFKFVPNTKLAWREWGWGRGPDRGAVHRREVADRGVPAVHGLVVGVRCGGVADGFPRVDLLLGHGVDFRGRGDQGDGPARVGPSRRPRAPK